MNLLAPLFLAGGLLIGLPILLHFLRKKTQRPVPFPSLRFLGPHVIQESKRHRIRRWIVLALRCLFLLLLALAFARPVFEKPDKPEGRLAIVLVDNSFSMGARGRWEELRSWAVGQVAQLEAGDRCGVMLMQPSPAWLLEPTDNLETARQTLETLKPGYFGTEYNRPLRFASDVLKNSPQRDLDLIVMADEQRVGWLGVDFQQPLPPGVRAVFAPPMKSPGQQAAITALQATPSRTTVMLEMETRLYAPETATRTLRVSLGARELGAQPITLTADKPLTTTLRVNLPEDAPFPAPLKVTMEADDVPADDARYVVIDPAQALPVVLVPAGDAGDAYLAEAIGATFSHKSLPLRAVEAGTAPWPETSVAVLRGSAAFLPPQGDHLKQHLAADRGALVFVTGNLAEERWLGEHGIRVKPLEGDGPFYLTDCDLDHPLFAGFTPQTVLPLLRTRFHKGWALEGDGLQPLARWPDGSIALALAELPAGRVVIGGFDIDRRLSDLALSPSFVPFLHRSVASLAESSTRRASWTVGETIPLPSSGSWEAVESPQDAPAQTVQGSIRTSLPGIFRFVPADGGAPVWAAVNVSAEESNLAPWTTPLEFEKLLSRESRVPPRKSFFAAPAITTADQKQNLWWWMLLVAAFLLLTELSLANRTAR